MRLLKAFVFAILIGATLSSSGCFMDDVVEPAVVYRSGFGYGYWSNNYWYGAPYGYRVGVRPYWGPRCYHPAPRPPSPYYHGGNYGYHSGYNGGGYHGGGFHGGFHGGGHR